MRGWNRGGVDWVQSSVVGVGSIKRSPSDWRWREMLHIAGTSVVVGWVSEGVCSGVIALLTLGPWAGISLGWPVIFLLDIGRQLGRVGNGPESSIVDNNVLRVLESTRIPSGGESTPIDSMSRRSLKHLGTREIWMILHPVMARGREFAVFNAEVLGILKHAGSVYSPKIPASYIITFGSSEVLGGSSRRDIIWFSFPICTVVRAGAPCVAVFPSLRRRFFDTLRFFHNIRHL